MSDEGSRDPGYYEALGRAIKVLRVTRGLERKDLADRAGISYPYLSQIESGAKRASSEVIRAIAEALDVRPHELLESADAVMTSQPAPGSKPRARATSGRALERIAADVPAPAAPVMAMMAAPPPPPQRARGGARWFHSESTPAPTPPSPADPTRRQLLGELVALTETLDDADLERLVDLARRLADT